MPVTLYSLLEVIHECIVDSGVPYKTLRQKRTGTYLAMTFNDEDAVTTSTFTESSYCKFPETILTYFVVQSKLQLLIVFIIVSFQ